MKAFVFTDAHGHWDLFEKATQLVGEDDICFFLGDAIDRGPDGLKIVDFLLSHSRNYVYLLGNHERLFIEAMWEYIDTSLKLGQNPYEFAQILNFNMEQIVALTDGELRVHCYNGGVSTFESWIKDTKCDESYIERLEALPRFASYQNYDFCHAGCFIEEWDKQDEHFMLWSRFHFHENWKKDRILVHGHTPIQYMKKGRPADHPIGAPLVYCNGTKINLDCGVFNTGVLNVLEINENGEQIFHTLTRNE